MKMSAGVLFRRIHFICAVFTFGFALSASGGPSVSIEMLDGADVAIKLSNPLEGAPTSGFLPLFLHIENRATQARAWDFSLSLGVGNGVIAATLSHFRAEVPAQSTYESVIYLSVPVAGASPSSGGLGLQGSVVGPAVRESNFFMYLNQFSPFAFPAVSRASASDFQAVQKSLPKVPSKKVAPGGGPVNGPPAVVVDLENWPADWRAWSSFGLFFLDTTEWLSLDPAHRKAVLDWVALGGRLILSPKESTSEVPRTAHGAGEIITLGQPLARSTYADLVQVGLRDHSRLEKPWDWITPLISSQDQARWFLEPQGSWIAFFLIVFGIVIGPVNLFVFARPGRRHRLFVTVPALSLLATLVLAGAIVVRDGLGGAGTRRALVVLLPGENQAAVFQEQVARTGLLTGRSFSLAGDTFLGREVDPAFAGTGGRAGRMERTGDQASGDWFTSRARQSHRLQRISPTRARVELVRNERADTPPSVQSTFTSTLHDFLYIDAKGQRWGGVDVAPGQRVILATYVAPRGSDSMNTVIAEEARRPGHFYARGGPTDLAPISTLPSIRWTDDTVVYTGMVEVKP